MSISHTDAGELRTIMISGRMDIGGRESPAGQLVQLTEAPSKVIVDLSTLTMLASIGIRALIASAKGVAARGGKMVLVVNPGSTIMTSIKTVGLDQLVPIFGSAVDAEGAAAA